MNQANIAMTAKGFRDSMATLHIDLETRSEVDLKKVGLDVYASHPTTEILCMAFAFDDEPVQLWHRGMSRPHLLVEHVDSGGKVVAHNAAFEMALWNAKLSGIRLRPEQMECTMAAAYAMGLPGSLGDAAAAMGITQQKDMGGQRLMLQMCKPRSTNPTVWWEDEGRLNRLYDYCKQDVEVERELHKRLMPLSESEQAVWVLDQKINQRGIYLDVPTIKAAIQIVAKEQDRLNAAMRKVTGGAVTACTSVGQLGDWIRWQGVDLGGIAKADVIDALAGDLPPKVREALRLRQEAAKSSTAKLKAMLDSVSTDNRVRNTLQYHGAATGRWAGRKIQTQNFPRGTIKPSDIEAAIELVATGDADAVDMLYGKPMDVVSSCLRGMITAAPDHELVCADFSAIEARVLAWLAGEEKVLDIFRGEGKIYEHAASGIYRKGVGDVSKDERQIGKVAVLALGYGGGVGAFQTMARGYGVQVSDERADEIKTAWRKANPNIVKYWYALESAAISAVMAPGTIFLSGAKGREVKYVVKGSFLWCQLPSKRVICYPYPQIGKGKFDNDALTYMFVDPLSRKWIRGSTYGGSLSENVTQAVARDLLAHALVNAESHGYPVVMHVHDEVVAEVETGFGSLHEFEQLMAEAPAWAVGLPTAAEGWRGKRYRKG